MNSTQRPLSPHLQVYKPQLTSVLSIFHRAAGVYLALGIIALALWIISLASPEPCFGLMTAFYASPFGQLLFASWILAFFYHFANGIRHLVWDAGYGYGLGAVYRGGWAVLIFTVLAAGFVLCTLFKGI
ncbi:MAG: succinate dehydrogenase, cytochrome b556 subunit [Alphaproteobacteria bacterium]|nr:succinate dehydrogenase, cytochrome b556 subunit [Alphaproteobacteria bacterium]NCQ66145.1 succinate dehydrogenase, cytochrome b556 subunit [Alphaproteobacteria bacterium]NCT06493.1 succinate dehydrogenase, cytochrome b556 subunit [Alphaproteobacteria bacterium]